MKKLIVFILLLSTFGFSRPLKAVFDCDVKDINWISLRLSLLKKTAESLTREGKEYKFVLTIHSHCITIVEKNLKKFPPKKAKKIEFIQSQLKTLKEIYNVEIKACRIAMDRGKISAIPQYITPVPNSWITLIELQNKGYAFVPF